MIVYRVQASTGGGWVNSWCATLAEARVEVAALEDVYPRVWLDKIEVGEGREGLVNALNHAGASRLVWEGDEV